MKTIRLWYSDVNHAKKDKDRLESLGFVVDSTRVPWRGHVKFRIYTAYTIHCTDEQVTVIRISTGNPDVFEELASFEYAEDMLSAIYKAMYPYSVFGAVKTSHLIIGDRDKSIIDNFHEQIINRKLKFTERQLKLFCDILRRNARNINACDIDVFQFLDNPKAKRGCRVPDNRSMIWCDEDKFYLRFPYSSATVRSMNELRVYGANWNKQDRYWEIKKDEQSFYKLLGVIQKGSFEYDKETEQMMAQVDSINQNPLAYLPYISEDLTPHNLEENLGQNTSAKANFSTAVEALEFATNWGIGITPELFARAVDEFRVQGVSNPTATAKMVFYRNLFARPGEVSEDDLREIINATKMNPFKLTNRNFRHKAWKGYVMYSAGRDRSSRDMIFREVETTTSSTPIKLIITAREIYTKSETEKVLFYKKETLGMDSVLVHYVKHGLYFPEFFEADNKGLRKFVRLEAESDIRING